MNVGQIVSITVTVSLVVLGLYFAQRGVRKGLIKAAMTTGNIVISALLACFLSRDVTTIARDYLYPLLTWILRLFGLGYVVDELAEVEGILTIMPLFLSVIFTPFLFLVFFWLFRTLIGIGLSFVYRSERKVKDEDGKKTTVKRHVPLWSRITGGVLGALNGVLLLAVLLLPFNGYANLFVNVADEYFSEIDTSSYTREGSSAGEILYYAVEDYAAPVPENWFLKLTHSTFGKPMFNHMTKTAYGEGEFGLESEAIVGIRLLRNGGTFVSSGLTNLNADSVKDLHEIVNTLDDSVLMPDLAATLIATMCDNWACGQDLYGLSRPDFGQTLNPTVDVLLRILATVDGKTIVTDLNTIIDVLDLLVQNGIFESRESEQLVNKLSQNPDLIKELTALFEANEHLAPMAGEIRQLCIRVVAQSLDMENSELTTQLTDSINAYKDQPEQLSKELTGIVQDYMDDQGISATVGTEVVDEVAEAISKEFADRDQVTEEEVIDFVLTYTQGNYTEDQIGSIVPGYGN